MRLRLLAGLALLTPLASACSSSSGEPAAAGSGGSGSASSTSTTSTGATTGGGGGEAGVPSLRIEPASATLRVELNAALPAVALHAYEKSADGMETDVTDKVTWIIPDSGIAAVGADGAVTVTGLEGATEASASVDGLSATAALTVELDPDSELAWSDEFSGAAGSPVDDTVWSFDTGGSGFGNAELEYYTSDAANASLDGAGHLAIVAREGGGGNDCWYGPCSHTSARLKTQGKLAQQYGRIEARLRIPRGQGLWPAFWMLGDDIAAAGWPGCGEIDVMENVGFEPAAAHGTIHGPGYSGAGGLGLGYTLPGGAALADDFHEFALEWDPGVIRWYVDHTLYETRTRADLPDGAPWVYDHPFFLILNVAVGGAWPGNPDATTTFPQTMLVDHVRVYRPYRTPYLGAPAEVPGVVEAEAFDQGGEGVAYHDADPQNQGGTYRAEEGVDVGASGDPAGGQSIGWAGAGEWLKYRVHVAAAGPYTLTVRVASSGAGGTFHVEADGVDVTGPLTAPDTGGWQTWQTVTKSGVTLGEGSVSLRLVLDTNGATGAVANFDSLELE